MPSGPGYEDILVAEIDRQAEQRAKAQAAEAGPAPGTRQLNDDRELREWNRSDDSIDVDALLAQGIGIEEITRAKHPNRVRMIESHSPDWTARCDFAEKLAKRAEEAKAKLTPHLGAQGMMPMPPMNGTSPMPPPLMSEPEQGGY